MSTVFNLDDDPIVLVVPSSANIPPGNITESEWLAIKDRVTVVEGNGIADLADVDLSDLADGRVLMWDEDADAFIAGETVQGIDVVDGLFEPIADNATHIVAAASRGIRAAPSGTAGYVYLEVVFGGTGSSASAARSDHTHFQPTPVRVTTAPSGYISGGSQSLGSTSVTLSDGIVYVVEAELYGQFRGADSGAAYYTVSITIGVNTFTSPGGAGGFWCVQGVPDKINWEHERKLTGTGAAVSVSASVAWHSGSGFNIDRTYLKVRVRPDR